MSEPSAVSAMAEHHHPRAPEEQERRPVQPQQLAAIDDPEVVQDRQSPPVQWSHRRALQRRKLLYLTRRVEHFDRHHVHMREPKSMKTSDF